MAPLTETGQAMSSGPDTRNWGPSAHALGGSPERALIMPLLFLSRQVSSICSLMSAYVGFLSRARQVLGWNGTHSSQNLLSGLTWLQGTTSTKYVNRHINKTLWVVAGASEHSESHHRAQGGLRRGDRERSLGEEDT